MELHAPERLADLASRLLDAAGRAGADQADVLVLSGRSVSIDVRAGALEQAERAEGVEIGLRALIRDASGARQACVSASDVSEPTLLAMAERAVAMAREAPVDPHAGLADPDQLSAARDAGGLELCDPADAPAPDQLEAEARAAEAAALGIAGVSQVQSASASHSQRLVHLAASNGFRGALARSSRAVSCVAIAGEGTGMERDWSAESRIFAADLPSPESIGQEAGERAVARLGARKPPTGSFPVLYDERISGGLIGHLLSAINGTSIARGASWLRDALGEEVLPPGLSLIEDPLRPRVPGSRRFDAEGLACARRAIVENGVLMGYTLDLGTARKLGLRSTASAARGVSGPPGPSVSNVALTPGTKTRAELIAEMGRGLLVTSMIGSTINPTTGDYSRGAAGFWVENGQIAYPVNECTVAGNLREMLARIIPANDGKAHQSHVVPSLLVEGLTLAGS
ncbi:TldD/PmbA family protein [Phaeovulum vinaykumarii]|uniref:PmbA protein n=1 Tax=Phaeovulum vinaykumarii TaxID=407234 RepID=A0A1N7MBL5_9RHOB|nr:TldD/PmbA family protein [Phaeovulum vinaykumarii]SIS83422.1 PmbA protein [Phaeovulum vinaykumarii]SOC10229.1 PmbA protein [Phaeovulum vinaykumarii]